MKNKKIEAIVLAFIILLQTLLYIAYGANKSYLHMDEAYSFGLSNYHSVEIQDNDDFYNTWHDGAYYEDYLVVNADESGDFQAVYEQQKNDVHPPFYYLLLRIMMEFHEDKFSYWGGLILNIIIGCFITVFTYLIAKKLLEGKPYFKEISALISAVSALILSSVSNVLYIRMYALATLMILLTVFFHLKLLECEKVTPHLLVFVGFAAMLGSLTHYYYLFFLAPLFLMMCVRYYRLKSNKSLLAYVAAVASAAVCSLIVFPHSLNHLFNGYRGQGALESLFDANNNVRIWSYLNLLDSYAFNRMLFFGIVIAAVLAAIKRKSRYNRRQNPLLGERYAYIYIPAGVYFVVSAFSSPYMELRYILPVCGILFVGAMTGIFHLLHCTFNGKISCAVIFVLSMALLVSPMCIELEPEYVYANRRPTVEFVETNSKCPAIYCFNSGNNRFLDDILLFSKLDESYIAKDPEINETTFSEIFRDKDTSNGVIVFINAGWQNDDVLETVKSSLGFQDVQWISRLNACDVYFLS